MKIFKTFTASLLLGSSLAVSTVFPAHAIVFNTNMAANDAAAANLYDQTNVYPSVVRLQTSIPTGIVNCSGTLINSRTILTAAHCLDDPSSSKNIINPTAIKASFGQNSTVTPYDQQSTGYTVYPSHALSYHTDMALVALTTPILANSITPVTLAKPTDTLSATGSLLATVGYGGPGVGTDTTLVDKVDGQRRSGGTRLGAYDAAKGVFQAQFRNPADPGNPDTFYLSGSGCKVSGGCPVPADQVGLSLGDSGGPLFLAGSLTQIGVASSGGDTVGYGSIGNWGDVAVKGSADWISSANPLRNVSAKAGDGNWSAAAIWSENMVPNNLAGSVSGASTASTGHFFNVTLSAAGTVSVDMSPTIDGLVVSGSNLNIQSTQTLKALTGSTMGSGSVAVHGTLSTPILHLNGGTLTGTGTVDIHNYGVLKTGTGVVNSGAIVAPGDANAIGTLTIGGDYIQSANGILSARLSQNQQADRLIVNGKAALGGVLRVAEMNGPVTLGVPYTVLTSQSLTGTFGSIDSATFIYLQPEVTYPSNSVVVTMVRNNVPLSAIARTFNQQSVGTVVNKFDTTNPLHTAIVSLDIGVTQFNQIEERIQAAFDTLSGELYTSMHSAFIKDSRFVRDAASDRMRAALESVAAPTLPVMAYGPDGPKSVPASVDCLTLWGGAFGVWGRLSEDGNAARFDRTTGGFLVGGDNFVDDSWRVGMLAGYSRTSFRVRARASSGSYDNYHLGLYGASNVWEGLVVRTSLGHAWHIINTTRSVMIGNFSDTLTAKYGARTLQGFGELGYRIDNQVASFEPFINLAYAQLHTNGFKEDGGAARLSTVDQSNKTTFSTLGLRASSDFSISETMKMTVSGASGWQHAYGDVTPQTQHNFTQGDAFTIRGTPITKDAAIVELGLNSDVSPGMTVGVSYNGQIASGAQQHGFDAKFKVKF